MANAETGFPPELREMFELIGFTHCVLNTAERTLRQSVEIMGEKGGLLTPARIDAVYERASRKTCGQALNAFGRFAECSPALTAALEKYVRQRNEFVHHFDPEHGYDIDSPEGRTRIRQLLTDLINGAFLVINMFGASFVMWARNLGVPFERLEAEQSEVWKRWNDTVIPILHLLVCDRDAGA